LDPDTYYAQAEPKDWPEATGLEQPEGAVAIVI
jgi:hypothetical protein